MRVTGRRVRRTIVAGVVLAVAAGFAWDLLQVAGTQRAFCTASGRGASAVAAIRAYLRRCGADYTLGGSGSGPAVLGPRSVEYSVNVSNNNEGSVGFMRVTRDTTAGDWRTTGPLSPGP